MLLILFILSLMPADTLQTVIVESSVKLFSAIVSISSTVDRNILVVDQDRHTVTMVNSRNEFVGKAGGQGWGNESLDLPRDVSTSFLLDLFVVDVNNRRVQRFDKQLHFIRTYDEASLGLTNRFQPIAAGHSSQGDIFILDDDGKKILKLNARGLVEREFGTQRESPRPLRDPKDLAVSLENQVFVLDQSDVLVFDVYGNYMKTISLEKGLQWKTIAAGDGILAVTSSQKILLISAESGEQASIIPSSFIGAKVDEPFSDVTLRTDQLIIATTTTLFRCTFPMP